MENKIKIVIQEINDIQIPKQWVIETTEIISKLKEFKYLFPSYSEFTNTFDVDPPTLKPYEDYKQVSFAFSKILLVLFNELFGVPINDVYNLVMNIKDPLTETKINLVTKLDDECDDVIFYFPNYSNYYFNIFDIYYKGDDYIIYNYFYHYNSQKYKLSQIYNDSKLMDCSLVEKILLLFFFKHRNIIEKHYNNKIKQKLESLILTAEQELSDKQSQIDKLNFILEKEKGGYLDGRE